MDRELLEALFPVSGCTAYRWMDPGDIVVSQWVRMKCTYGCDCYGENACCPPSLPTVPECRQFFREYSSAVVFHFQRRVADPGDRAAWSRMTNAALLSLEREVFLRGYHKVFLLFMDCCRLCARCAKTRIDCTMKEKARPSPEGMAVDVFSTVRQLGLPIEVLTDPSQVMNRYAFLLIE